MSGNLGSELRALLRPHTGELADAQPAARGFGADLTTVIECERGPFFVKAMRNRPGGRRDSIMREKAVNAFVRSVSPALRWTAGNAEWIVLGFEVVEGRPSNFEPGSRDLPTVVGLLNRLAALECPEVARDWPETRWDRFAANEAEAKLFRGDALLHTDVNPDNLLVGDRDSWVVDWSWPTRGAAFIDPACLVVQLVSAGHSPEAAEGWISHCHAWTDADPGAIDAFAAATVRMHWTLAQRRPDEAWLKAMAEAAETWSVRRGVSVT
jgi:hypothetical protein